MPEKPERQLVTLSDADEERVYVLDAQGNRRLVGIKREYVVTDANGPRVVREQILVQTADGRTIDPSKPVAIFDCPFCQRKNLSLYSIRYCERCQRITCLMCTHGVLTEENSSYYCPECWNDIWWDQQIHFYFFSLTNRL